MTELKSLLEDFLADRIGLSELLQALENRGAVGNEQYLADLHALNRAVRDDALPLQMRRAIHAKIDSIQDGVGKTGADAERTVIRKPGAKPAEEPADIDKTVVGTAAEVDETVIIPARASRGRPMVDQGEDDRNTVAMPVADFDPRADDDPDQTAINAASEATEATRQAPPRRPPPSRPAEDADVTAINVDEQPHARQAKGYSDGTAMLDTTAGSGRNLDPGTGPNLNTDPSASQWGDIAGISDPSVSILPGYLLKGRFLLEKEIGRGGMGIVYKAVDKLKEEAQDRDPHVAIKVLNDDFRQHPDALKALQREARKSQLLNHDHIVRVYDFDRDGGTIYMTMEWVDGRPLNELIRDPEFEGMSLTDARPIIEGIGAALTRAHKAGIVHSDFKPGNVLLRKDGVAKVFDFGIARAAKSGEHVSGETTVFDAGSLGALTPAYASLEMLHGVDPDPRDDLYALAITIYELLMGRHPYKKRNAQRAMDEGIVPDQPGGLSRAQWKALLEGLAFKRDDRPPTIEIFLDRFLQRHGNWKRYRWPLIAAGSAILLVGLAIGPILDYVDQRAADSYLEALRTGKFDSLDAARTRFDALDPAARQQMVETNSEAIRKHFVDIAQQAWNPAEGHYRYPRALKAYEQLSYMAPMTVADVVGRLQSIEGEKNQLLSDLNEKFELALEGGRLYPDETDSVESTLRIVEQMEPDHSMVNDARVALAYADSIGELLNKDQFKLAEERLEVAVARFPADETLANLQSEVADRVAALSAAEEAAAIAALETQKRQQRIATLKSRLDDLLQRPSTDSSWNTAVQTSFTDAQRLLGDDDAWLARNRARAAEAYLQIARERTEQQELSQALVLAGLGLELRPGDAGLVRQRNEILRLQAERERQAATRGERIEVVRDRLDTLLASAQFSSSLDTDIQRAFKDVRELAGDDVRWLKERERTAGDLYLRLSKAQLDAGNLNNAQRLIDRGLELDPASRSLRDQKDAIAAAAQLAQTESLRLAELARKQAREDLIKLLGRPNFTSIWEAQVGLALSKIDPQDAQLDALQSEVARAYAKRAEELGSRDRFDEAVATLDRGRELVPDSSKLEAVQQSIAAAKAQFDRERMLLAQEARIKGLKNSLVTQARANDTDRASRSLSELRDALGSSDAYVVEEAEPLVAEAFLNRAQASARRDDFAQAANVLEQGIQLLPKAGELRSLLGKLRSAADEALLAEAAGNSTDLGQRRLRDARDRLRRESPDAWRALVPRLEASISSRVRELGVSDRGAAERLIAGARSLLPDSGVIAGLRVPDSRRIAVDSCKVEFAGFGRKSRATCFDELPAGQRGPRLVVVPGLGNGAPFAITKYEVSVQDFNVFCQMSGSCTPEYGGIELLPRSGITLEQMNAYARWLSEKSGFDYRLPTDSEWEHAARAAGGGPGDDFNCLLKQGASTIKGDAPIKINVGQAGGWGVVNIVGNLQEVTMDGSRAVMRGGSFRDSMSQCDVDLKRRYNGQADETVGFRVVRPLG